MKKSALILFIILVSASLFTFADDTAGGLKMGFEKINDRIFVVNNIEGYATRMVVLSGTKGLAIIDTAHTLEITQKAKEIIKRELGRDDYIYVVNTHGHYDHISGNQLFPGIPIIGHDLCVETVKKFASRKKEYIEYWGGQVDKAKEQLAATRDSKEAAELKHLILLRSMQVANLKGSEFVATPPNKTFSKEMKLDLGDLTLELSHLSNNHGQDHILVYVPEEKLLITGDVMTDDYPTSLSPSKVTNLDYNLEQLTRFTSGAGKVEKRINSHPDMFATVGGLEYHRFYMDAALSLGKKFKKSGKTLEDYLKAAVISDLVPAEAKRYPYWSKQDLHEKNLKLIWEYLNRD